MLPIQPPAWARRAVVYEIIPDRFAASERVSKPGALEPWDAPPTTLGFKGGDLLGVVEHLDHIVGLGVTAIYLTPIFQSAANHRYHTYDYFRVDPLLGGDAALRELIDACHARGVRVILDGVFNHVGRGFWPFHHVVENGGASPYRDWFHLDQAVLEGGALLDAYPPDGEPPWGYQAWWGLPALPKLNIGNADVRAHLLAVVEHWLRFGIDGWRLDVPLEIDDPTFWQAVHERARSVNPEAWIVAEIWHDAPEAIAANHFDGQMDYPLTEAILSYAGAGVLDERVLAQHGELARNIGRIDAAAFAARLTAIGGRSWAAGHPAPANLTLLDSHDTPRLRSMLGGDAAAVRLASLLLFALPGAPCVYYGDELGLAGEMDPGCRAGMPWAHPESWDHDLLAFVSAVAHFRRAHAELRADDLAVTSCNGGAIGLLRGGILVALNAGTEAATVELGWEAAAGARLAVPVATDPNLTVIEVARVSGPAAIEIPARTGLFVTRPA